MAKYISIGDRGIGPGTPCIIVGEVAQAYVMCAGSFDLADAGDSDFFEYAGIKWENIIVTHKWSSDGQFSKVG